MSAEVDAYIDGSDRWAAELAAVRPILLGCGLDEQIKWRSPCYSHEGANIVILQEMKAFLALMFFKGALLTDPDGLLRDQGPNSRSARRLEFTSTDEIATSADAVRALVAEAVANEEAGLEVEPSGDLELVEELRDELAHDPALQAAFSALTPGRQRAYNLDIGGAKKSETRAARVAKHRPRILAGKGLRDR